MGVEPIALAPGEPDYPRCRGRKHPLYLRGALPAGFRLAIVGSREAGPASLAFARRAAQLAVRAGISVWSGGAIGIDAAAHEGALDAGVGSVAVVPGSVVHATPRAHASLFDRTVEAGGGVLSRDADLVVVRAKFHERNRLLVSLVDAMLVVQARFGGGAQQAAGAALRAGVPLFVVPFSPFDASHAGSAKLLVDGARPITHADQLVAEVLRLPSPHLAQGGGALLHDRLRALLASGPLTLDEACQRLDVPVAEAQAAVLELLFTDDVESGLDGRLRVTGQGNAGST